MFSCIIPVYNSSHLDIQINNLKSLSFFHGNNIEYIFVNDGSDDDFIQQLQIKIKDDARFSLVSLPPQHEKQNRVTQARNLWAQHARWEVLFFIDQDTLVSQKYIETFQTLSLWRKEVFLWPYYGYNNHKKILSPEIIEEYLTTWEIPQKQFIDFRVGIPQMLQQEEIWKFFCASNLLIRRDDFLGSGWFDELITTWWDEDVEFWYRVSQKYKITFQEHLTVLNLSEKLYNNPYNILEDIHISSLFENILRNFEKHKTKEYLSYLLERYNWLSQQQKLSIWVRCNTFLQWIHKKIY